MAFLHSMAETSSRRAHRSLWIEGKLACNSPEHKRWVEGCPVERRQLVSCYHQIGCFPNPSLHLLSGQAVVVLIIMVP